MIVNASLIYPPSVYNFTINPKVGRYEPNNTMKMQRKESNVYYASKTK